MINEINKQMDVFGQELYDALNGIESPEIVERDDNYITSGLPIKRYLDNYSAWPLVVRRALRYARGRVLDVGCGAGRHSLYLQGKGLEVVGLDISPMAIEVCKLRGLKNTVTLPITRVSRKLGQFDTILMLENNFGLFENPDRAKHLLNKFYTITSHRGRIIAQSSDPYNTSSPDDLEYHHLNRARGRLAGQIRMRLRYKRLVSAWFDYLMVSQEEMLGIAKGTGWNITKFLQVDSRNYVAIMGKTL
jgi:SAM-dependent methyltransferase